jgi:ATP-dependent DNA helicase RecQ
MKTLSTGHPVADPARAVLARHFAGIADFRDRQEEVIARLVAGESLLYLAPTGSGKSLAYQVAGLLRGGLTVVVSPLRALIGQQCAVLKARGLAATELHYDIESRRQFELLRDEVLHGNSSRFLFLSPERAFTDGFVEYVLTRLADRIGLVVIDEAHCISQWGHSFRPAYRGLPDFLNRIFPAATPRPPVLCLTATLNPREEAEIRDEFALAPASVVRSACLRRSNLDLSVEDHEDEPAKLQRLAELLADPARGKTLVYVHRKSGEYGTSAMAERFGGPATGVDFFDADRKDADKRAVLEAFQAGTLHTVFATSAFGMGIDIPDIRLVIHYLMPESAEQYYQEVGRAGRDGAPACGILLYSPTNVSVRRDLIARQFPTAEDLRAVLDERLALRDEPTTWNLYDALDGHERALASFHHLVRAGCVEIVDRGIGTLSAFKPHRGPCAEFEALQRHSRIGRIGRIARELDLPLRTVRDTVFGLYAGRRLKLAAAPDKVLFLRRGRPLDDATLAPMLTTIAERCAWRLEQLDRFVAILEAGGDPTPGVLTALGIADGAPRRPPCDHRPAGRQLC